MRATDFGRVKHLAYLDWAGRAIYPDSHIDNFTNVMTHNLYGNPHSESESSERSLDAVSDLRKRILAMFGTNPGKHVVILTMSGAHSFKTLVESFPFAKTSKFLYGRGSDKDVVELGGLTSATAVAFDGVPEESSFEPGSVNLVEVPLVSALDGSVMSDEEMLRVAKLNETVGPTVFTVADASEYLPTRRLDLNQVPFDALFFDCEKMFGFPKLGVLLLANHFVNVLERPYFGGGTIVYALTSRNKEKIRLRPSERFEDGSLPFLNIVAAESGFRFFSELNWVEDRKSVV